MPSSPPTCDDSTLIRPLSDLYPATSRWLYIDSAMRGLLPVTARERALEWLESRLVADGSGDESACLVAQSCRTRFAGLVGAGVDDIRMTLSFGDGLNALVDMMDAQNGANIVLCPALSHPRFVSFWRNHAVQHRLELREVPPGPSGFEIAELLSRIDEHTRMVALPAVSHLRGWRIPLGDVGQLCRAENIFFLVDGTSAVGVLQTDVIRENIDGLVVAEQDNALGLYGVGFVYAAPGWQAGRSAGALRVGVSCRGGAALPGDSGVQHMIGPAMAFEVLGVFSECGVARIERHALGLAERLRVALEDLGLFVERPRDRRQLSHVTAIGEPAVCAGGIAGTPELQALADQLVASRVRFTVRGGQLLFGFNLYNKLRDVMEVRRIAAQHSAG